jgi:hypothetical protein
MALFQDGGEAQLNHNGSLKLQTKSTGIQVTGTVAATAYTGDGSNLTGVGSPSIDDNGVATVITIDSSDRVLTDTTNTSAIAQTGNAMTYDNGRLEVQKYRSPALRVGNYTDAFGAYSSNLVELYSGGTAVGSIGANGGVPYITCNIGGGVKFSYADSTHAVIFPVTTTGAVADNAHDLGYANARFRDAYLSGGVYLGGTGSANKLEDYESGTWNPTYTSSSTDPTFSPNLQNGEYTKIGRMVYASFRLRGAISGTKTGNLRLSGLPFTANSSPANGSGGVGLTENFGASNYPTNLRVNQSATYINLMVYDNADPRDGLFTNVTVTSTSGSSSGNYIIGHVVYQTDS